MSRPSRKSRWYSRYSPRSASQNATFCESNAPLVMTGLGVHERPMNRVGRLEGVQPVRLAADAERLVLRTGRAFRVRVAERHERVRPDAVPHDVVLLRAIPFEQPQLRLRPMHAVRAIGITIDVARVRAVLAAEIGKVAAAVVHAVLVAVLKHGDVVGRVPFPRLVSLQRDFARHRWMQPQLGPARQSFDERVVHEHPHHPPHRHPPPPRPRPRRQLYRRKSRHLRVAR